MDRVRVVNRAVFLLSVVLTGAIAGVFVWLVLLAMNVGLALVWDGLASWFGRYYPILMCMVGGVVIGLFARRYGQYPEDLPTVMAKVKRDGRYGYDKLGRMSVAALLPLVFGGSVGPEAGLTGVIAGLCSWVGDRMKRFGADFRELSEAGVTATLSALFTAPLYGFAAGISGRPSGDGEAPTMSRWTRAVVYVCAIAGALGAMLALNHFIGGGMSLPHYDWDAVGRTEVLWLIPLILVGAVAGWLYCISDSLMSKASDRVGDRPVLKPVLAGAVLGVFGVVMPMTMFSGESQVEELDVPVIVDAGIGKPSQACEAMELGCAAVMANTAIATARDVPMMARAFRTAIEAGRMAYLAGTGRVLEGRAEASSPLTGFLGGSD